MNKDELKKISDHLADMQGFLSGLHAFGIIPKASPVWTMLDEMAKKNKKVYDELAVKIEELA